MNSLIENYRDADGEAVQPYFAAFMIDHGYTRAKHAFERDGHNCEFMEWIRRMWATFERARGFPVDHYTRNTRSGEFTEWLNARCVDFAARRFVEAA